jgi:predicted Zn-dependent peptidase
MINRQLERYLAVTAADIQAAAAEVLRPDNRAVLTYMPAVDATAGTTDEETAA